MGHCTLFHLRRRPVEDFLECDVVVADLAVPSPQREDLYGVVVVVVVVVSRILHRFYVFIQAIPHVGVEVCNPVQHDDVVGLSVVVVLVDDIKDRLVLG